MTMPAWLHIGVSHERLTASSGIRARVLPRWQLTFEPAVAERIRPPTLKPQLECWEFLNATFSLVALDCSE